MRVSVEVVLSSTGWSSPILEPWVPGYLVSLALGLSSYCLRHVQIACSYRCRSCSSRPSPFLFFLAKTSASWVLMVSSAPDSEQAITFGSFSLLGIALRPRLLLTKWLVGEAARELGSLFPFSFGVVVSSRMLERELEWDFPSGCSSFSLRGCPASALAVAGNGCRVLRACLFFGTVTLFPFETLLFPSYAPWCRYDVPGVFASGSDLAASA